MDISLISIYHLQTSCTFILLCPHLFLMMQSQFDRHQGKICNSSFPELLLKVLCYYEMRYVRNQFNKIDHSSIYAL